MEVIIEMLEYKTRYLLRVKELPKDASYWYTVEILKGGPYPPQYIRKESHKILKTFTPEKYPEYFI